MHLPRTQLTPRSLHSKRTWLLLFAVVFLLATVFAHPASAAVAYRGVGTGNNAGGATTLSLTKPTGTVMNDVMVAVVSVRGGTGVTGVTSPGWTQINATDSTTVLKSITFYKVATSSEAASYTFTFAPATAQKASGVIVAYSGVDTADPINIAGVQANASNTVMTAPSITTTVANTMLVAMFSTATGTTAPTAGSSMTWRGQDASTGSSVGTRTTTAVQDALQAAATASGTKTMTAGAGAVNIGHLIALRPAPTVSQAKYRFFQNTDSTTASTPLAAADTAVAMLGSTPFRLRLNLGVASGGTSMTNVALRTFTLQYALRGADNLCDASFSGESYSDVTTSSTVRFYNNPTPADGAAYVTSANDPTRAGITAVSQKYEESNPLTVGTTTPSNQDALWDVSLTTSGVTVGQVYCLRTMDTNNATVLGGGYGVVPEFSIIAPVVTQANYRWLTNADSATPGAALAAQDTSTTVSSGAPVRLRERLAVDTASLPASYENYKLQYAEKVGTCDTSFTGENYIDLNAGVSTSSQTMNAGSVAADASYGTRLWTNPSNAAVGDGLSAQSSAKTVSAANTNYLVSSGHGFSIPANATVTGIAVGGIYTEQVPSMPGFGAVFDASAKLLKGGVLQTTDRATGATDWAMSGWGGSTDLWGTTWTPADINDAGFGAAIAAAISGDNTNNTFANVDQMSITVYYTVPVAATMQYYNNPTPADGAAISSTANDPTNAARTAVYQTYRETDPFSNTAQVTTGSDGMWDFAIVANAAGAGKTYCFRTVKSTGSLLGTYSQIPELTIAAPAGPTLDQQLRGGQSLINGAKGSFTW